MEYYGQAAQDFFVTSILKNKTNGYFLEIGSNHPINGNNTYKMEKELGWKGIMVEYDSSFHSSYIKERPKSIHLIGDARSFDYLEELQKANFPNNMDYLQIDLDVDNRSTLDVLEKLNSTVFNTYKFATITFEHDIYRGDYFNTRAISRKIFESRGYIRIFPDIAVDYNDLKSIPFEDWYVHPDIVDIDLINKLIHHTSSHYSIIVDKLRNIQNNFFFPKIMMSNGEILDRYSILDIKNNEISDSIKKSHIQSELKLYESYQILLKENYIYYKLLFFVNKRIWDLTNIIKGLTILNEEYATIAYNIFEYNQQRFRVKNIINAITNSTIMEQKSYNSLVANININEDSTDVINNIIWLLLNYDTVNIYITPELSNKFRLKINILFPSVNIVSDRFTTDININNEDSCYILLQKFIEEELKSDINPLFYIASGKLGDFILQLSIINEKYISSGRKGILYINDIMEPFQYSVDKTYKDIYSLIIKQNYIQQFKIWNNEEYDINLSEWRLSPLLFQTSWHNIFKNVYNIEWGVNKWVITDIKLDLKDKIVIAPTKRSFSIDLNIILDKFDNNNIIFVGYLDQEYNDFISKYNRTIKFIKCRTIEDMAIIINSCFMFIGCMSSPLTLAQATHSNCIALLDYGVDANHNLLSDILPTYVVMR